MLVTFGATFFGVITSFILWYTGQWWLARKHAQRAVKHMLREINEEIAININILLQLTENIPKMLSGGNIPVFLPHRMQLSVYHYLVSSGELRLLNANKRMLIMVAGMNAESFNKFVENSESVLTVGMGLPQPQSLVVAKHRLHGLAEDAQDSAKTLNGILEKLKGES